MASPLVDTKLYAPRPRPDLVARPQLTERVERGTARKLTLISAPPGFGKTTLLAEWLASHASADRSVGWLSLDQADNEPSTFWTSIPPGPRSPRDVDQFSFMSSTMIGCS